MADTTTIVTDHIVPQANAGSQQPRAAKHFAWIDLRGVAISARDAIVQSAIHHGVDGVVADDPAALADLPPTMRRILAVGPATDVSDELSGAVDVVLSTSIEAVRSGSAEVAADLVISDAATLEQACTVVRQKSWTVLTFTDPTKIPLEIVIAAAENSAGRIITVVNDIQDAEIVKIVLEHGSDGLLLAPKSPDDVAVLVDVVNERTERVPLVHLTIERVEHIGMGERACIDTCSLLHPDEGCLIGSFSTGMFLSCSETHPLPYMPTRPFRWNAGAVHSYVLVPDNRTRYVSELRAGQPILAVRSDGTAREVRIGRVKIERRPLISITAVTPAGATVNVIAQDDWHVRLLGPGGSVNNVTDLRPGDVVLGVVPSSSRHVGLPITEFCDER